MRYYVVDAFADKLFEGNPAGVCVLENWISPELMQKIAIENNLSETAFLVKEGNEYRLRWFTPGREIDLCGHATLASAFVLAHFIEEDATEFIFQTKSGKLEVVRKDDLYEMDFPSYDMMSVPVTEEMERAIGFRPLEAWLGRDLVCVLDEESKVYNAEPNQAKVMQLDGLLLHLTAKSSEYDCVTRSFAPKLEIKEDPVCGSGHCHVIPLWAKKTGKNTLTARQASRRGGTLYCENCGQRVKLSGKAVLYATSELHIDGYWL